MTAKELEHLSLALDQATRLKDLLELEFSALKTQDLAAFDNLQPLKIDILSFLSSDDLSQQVKNYSDCLLYTSPSPRDMRRSRMPSSA